MLPYKTYKSTSSNVQRKAITHLMILTTFKACNYFQNKKIKDNLILCLLIVNVEIIRGAYFFLGGGVAQILALFREHLKGKSHCTIDLLICRFRNVLLCSTKFSAPSEKCISKPVKQEVNLTVILPPLSVPC